jgi:glutamine amidotransferase
LLKNTHPFRRELSGNVHVFAHNGNLPGIQEALPLDRREFMVPVGDTDSEHAFCLLMQRLHKASMTKPGLLRLDARIRLVTEFAHEISLLGPANFLYSDGDVLFVFGHIRTQEDGNCVAPGLHYRTVECSYGLGQSTAVSVELNSACTQTVTLVSTYPLHSDNWIPMQSNQLLVVRRGAVIFDQVDATTPRLLRSISGGL